MSLCINVLILFSRLFSIFSRRNPGSPSWLCELCNPRISIGTFISKNGAFKNIYNHCIGLCTLLSLPRGSQYTSKDSPGRRLRPGFSYETHPGFAPGLHLLPSLFCSPLHRHGLERWRAPYWQPVLRR